MVLWRSLRGDPERRNIHFLVKKHMFALQYAAR